MQTEATLAPSTRLGLAVVRADGTVDPVRHYPRPVVPERDLTFADIYEHGLPRRDLPAPVRDWRTANFRNLMRGWSRLAVAKQVQRYTELPFIYCALYLRVFRADGGIEDLGLASLRVVTSAGVNYLAADMAGGANDISNMRYHGFGTGTTAEASGDTTLVTEETTQYNPDSTRPTGSQSASTNTYTTVGTYTPDSGFPRAITEHGIFSATSAGTLWDRSVFSAVNLASGDSVQATHVTTFPAGS